jgi:cell fate (sporulation/competence/biofilm development) regulator YlbF (YheA/YmcA/DUF963 family)
MKDPVNSFPETVRKSADNLGDLLQASEPFTAFAQSKEQLEKDQEAQALLRRLNDLHQMLLALQAQGTLTQEQVSEFRNLQAQAHANPSIRTFALAQQAATQYLREINGEISQQLGVDFATLARRSCGS